MKKSSKIFTVLALMCICSTVAYSQNCNSYLQLATEMVGQKEYCKAKKYYQEYSRCNADADVSSEIAMCERYLKLQGVKCEEYGKYSGDSHREDTPQQDVITLKNGDDIQAQVVKIDKDDVEYKKGNRSYILKKTEIFKIKYANGDQDMFNTSTSTPSYPVNQTQPYTNNPNQSYSYSQEILPVYHYTFGNRISPDGSKKSPALAGWLSFFIPGLGQWYNGDIGGGFLYMGCNIVANSVWMTAKDEGTLYAGFGAGLLINVFAIINANQIAKKVNLARGYTKKINYSISPAVLPSNNFTQKNNDYAFGASLKINF